MEGRASKHYKNFVDTYIFYCKVFDSGSQITDILNIPYPLFRDVIEAQVKERKAEMQRFKENQK